MKNGGRFLTTKNNMITKILNEILQICCNEFELTIDDVKGKCRATDYVYCRAAFVAIVKEKFDLSNGKIGNVINRTHNDIQYLHNHKPTTRYFSMIFTSIKNKVNAAICNTI